MPFFISLIFRGAELINRQSYFQLDSRGRFYPIVNYFEPTGSDLAKSLLMFNHGVPWSENVERALAIHTANCAGEDKISLDDRVLWTYVWMDEILKASKNTDLIVLVNLNNIAATDIKKNIKNINCKLIYCSEDNFEKINKISEIATLTPYVIHGFKNDTNNVLYETIKNIIK